jgi:hypothetical protein
MLFLDGGALLFVLALWLYCLFDVITTPEGHCRNLPKGMWLMVVLLLPDIGSIIWLVAGKEWSNSSGSGLRYKGNTGSSAAARYPEYDRPGRVAASNPDNDEEFLARLRARAEEQRSRAPKPDSIGDDATG